MYVYEISIRFFTFLQWCKLKTKINRLINNNERCWQKNSKTTDPAHDSFSRKKF